MTVQAPDPVNEAINVVKIVIVIAVIGIITYMGFRIKSLEADNAQQATEIVEYKNANDDWKAKTDAANAAIKKFQDEVDAAAIAVATAQKDAAVIEQSDLNDAKKIQELVPQGDDCTATKNFLNSYFAKKKP